MEYPMRACLLLGIFVVACEAPEPSLIEVHLGGVDISGIDETAAPLPETTDSLGPYVLTALAREGRPIRRVELIECDSAQDCIFQAQRDCDEEVEGRCVAMEELTPGIFQGEIPGKAPGNEVFFVIKAEAQGGFIDFFPEIRNGEGVPASFAVVEAP
jgi:hypothetical protein